MTTGSRSDPAVSAAREAVEAMGFFLANLAWDINRGSLRPQNRWTAGAIGRVAGTRYILIGGSIGTCGYTAEILPLIAKRRICELADNADEEEPDIEFIVCPGNSADVGALGATAALSSADRESIVAEAAAARASCRMPVVPMLDIGGTKTNLVLAHVDADGAVTDRIYQRVQLPTHPAAPEAFYSHLASTIAPMLRSAGAVEVVPVLSVGQPGLFSSPTGMIEVGARDLGEKFVGCYPAALLMTALSRACGRSFVVRMINDGQAQMAGILRVLAVSRPVIIQRLRSTKVAYIGIGTGMGSGFGRTDERGRLAEIELTLAASHVSDPTPDDQLPKSRYCDIRKLVRQDRKYGALVSGHFVRRFMHEAESSGAGSLFSPHVGLSDPSPQFLGSLLQTDDRGSPFTAAELNRVLEDWRAIDRVILEVDCTAPKLTDLIDSTLRQYADELDHTLVSNLGRARHEFLAVIEAVRLVRRRSRRVHFVGIGKSHTIAEGLCAIYRNLGIDAAVLELTGADSENLTAVHQDDLVFFISNSGRAAELLNLVPVVSERGSVTVAITGDPKSPLSRRCHHTLDSHVNRNPARVAEAPTTSTTSALAVGTAISVVVSHLFDYDRALFDLDHPDRQYAVEFGGFKADHDFDPVARLADAFRQFAAGIRNLINDPEFTPSLIELAKRILITRASGRPIFLTGAGSSLRVAEKVAATFTSLGIDAIALNLANLPHGDFAHLRSGDLLIVASFSGETRRVISLVENAVKKQVICAGITSSPASRLARDTGDLCLIAGRGANDGKLVPIPDQKILSSFIDLAVGDSLAVLLAELIGANDEAFARDAHPGGAIGRENNRIPLQVIEGLSEDVVNEIRTSDPVAAANFDSFLKRSKHPNEIMAFGAGAMGLAYLGSEFDRLGQTLFFVDQNSARVAAIRVNGGYSVMHCPEGRVQTIRRVSAMELSDCDRIAALALRINHVVVSVGVDNLDDLIPTIAAITKNRYRHWVEEPINFVLVENMPCEENPLGRFRHDVRASLGDPDLEAFFDEYVGLVPAIEETVVPSVDTLTVPLLREANAPPVCIDRKAWKTAPEQPLPAWGGNFVFVDNFRPLHLRKIYVHNMGHFVLALLGHFAGYRSVDEVVADPRLRAVARKAMLSVAVELYRKWTYDDFAQPEDYVDWRLKQYEVPRFNDLLSRVAREAHRKLQKHDRLIGPVNYVWQHGATGKNVAAEVLMGVVAAIHYAAEVEGRSYNTERAEVIQNLHVDSSDLVRAEIQLEALLEEVAAVTGRSTRWTGEGDDSDPQDLERMTTLRDHVVPAPRNS